MKSRLTSTCPFHTCGYANCEGSIAQAERRPSGLLKQYILDLDPWSFRANAIVHLNLHRRITIQRPKTEPHFLRVSIVALIDRGTATAREKAPNAGTRLPTLHQVFTSH